VLAAKDFFYVGNAAFIDHGDHLYTMYFHMSELKVQTGDRVVRGQLLGNVGSTGRATGPHVHFGIKLAGTYINPADLLAYQPGAICVSKE
ncbi:MAG TPA: M23 family metallopeptidase, partial [Myxococcota bacterium]|nr:M23 family metallopeptidase [Myxococcota bacterium]